MKTIKYSDKVKAAQKRLKLKNVDLYSALGCTPPTLTSRLKENNWRVSEVEILNELLNIK